MRSIAFATVLMIFAAGCSLPTDEQATVIDQDRLDQSLQRVTTTSTTTLPISIRPVAYYLLREATGETPQRKVKQVVVDIPDTDDLFELLQPMFEDDFADNATAEEPEELINQATAYLLSAVSRPPESPTATVFLESRGEPPGNPVLKDVAAQLVWTLTGFSAVDSILINIDGSPVALPTTDDDTSTTEAVDRTRYQSYDPEIVEEPPSTTTTSTTTTTTTTVPPAPSDG
jgi:Sporulation and spore germination